MDRVGDPHAASDVAANPQGRQRRHRDRDQHAQELLAGVLELGAVAVRGPRQGQPSLAVLQRVGTGLDRRRSAERRECERNQRRGELADSGRRRGKKRGGRLGEDEPSRDADDLGQVGADRGPADWGDRHVRRDHATAGGSSTLTLAADATMPPGAYAITITGTARSATHTATVSLVVTADFSISASPTTVSVIQGSAGTITLAIAATGSADRHALGERPARRGDGRVQAAEHHRRQHCDPTLTTDVTTPDGTYPITVTGIRGMWSSIIVGRAAYRRATRRMRMATRGSGREVEIDRRLEDVEVIADAVEVSGDRLAGES
ncbi:MAG TPA: hypothetical protein VFT22_33270, partial [Kofleriaceae bacterium]|nr:hypothetical protein [Kofleriaceae bacterium]